jgi:hypothetical protein
MLEALIAGQRDPHQLAELARGRLRAKHAALVEAPHRPVRRPSRRAGPDAAGPDRRPVRSDHQLIARIDELIAAIPAAAAPTDTAGHGGVVPLPAMQRLDEIPAWAPASPRSSSRRSAWT